MRISDWSSDVCSSDLGRRRRRQPAPHNHRGVLQFVQPLRKHIGTDGRKPLAQVSEALGAQQQFANHQQGPALAHQIQCVGGGARSEEHTSELPSLMSTSYAAVCLSKKMNTRKNNYN